DDLLVLQVDLADGTGVLLGHPGPAAVAAGHDAVRLVGDGELLHDAPGAGVEEDDAVVVVDGDGGQRAGADPGDPLRLVADRDLVQLFAGDGIDHGDRAVVRVGNEQQAAVGRHVHEAVRGVGAGGGDDAEDGEKDDDGGSQAHALVPWQVGEANGTIIAISP